MNLNELLISLSSYHTILVSISFAVLILLKRRQAALFAGVTAFFFLAANLYFPYLLEWDSGNIYRYFVWIFHDVAWMGTIALLGLRDKITWRQSVLGQLLCIPILALNVFRAMDKYFIKLDVGLAPYQFIYPIFETAIVALCWLPIFVFVKNKFFSRSQTA